MIRFLTGWLKAQKKWLLILIAVSLISSFAAGLMQKKSAEEWQSRQAETTAQWYEDTKMEMIRGEQNPWNDYIGLLLSDLSMLKIYWKDPEQYAKQIVQLQNEYYQKAAEDAGYCSRVLHEDISVIQQYLQLAEAYKQHGWQQPLNPEKPRAGYLVYRLNHNVSWIVLLILAVCCGISIWIWSWMFETRSHWLLFTLPYSKAALFGAHMALGCILPLLYLLIQYGSLWLTGLVLAGDQPLIIIENQQILPCSSAAAENLIYPSMLCLFFSIFGAFAGTWLRNRTDTAMIEMAVLMMVYFLLLRFDCFVQIENTAWIFAGIIGLILLVLTWKKFRYDA